MRTLSCILPHSLRRRSRRPLVHGHTCEENGILEKSCGLAPLKDLAMPPDATYEPDCQHALH